MHRILWENPQPSWPLSVHPWLSTSTISQVRRTHQTFHCLWMARKEQATKPMYIFNMPWDARKNKLIQPGQWVWLSTRDLHLHLHLHLPCHKVPGMQVPFKIIRQLTPVSYHLQLPANYCISPTFHVSLLKPAGGPRGRMKKVTQWTPHPSLWMARRSITSSATVVPPSQQQRS